MRSCGDRLTMRRRRSRTPSSRGKRKKSSVDLERGLAEQRPANAQFVMAANGMDQVDRKLVARIRFLPNEYRGRMNAKGPWAVSCAAG